MNTLLNIDELAGTTIVPVWCGNERGTAFFISETQLLTAFHVVVENKVDGSAIYINVDGLDVECSYDDVAKDRDLALLTCKNYRNDESHFRLLASDCRKGQSLSIIGYPEELGNGIDIFKFNVTNIRPISNPAYQFDIIVRRTDELSLSSYAGMSGSPVINEFGSVIGVVTDEMYNTLGYTSIHCVLNELRNKGLCIDVNADLEDTSDFGLGTCALQVTEAQEQAGSRYSYDLQVEDKDIENEIFRFSGVGFEADVSDIIKTFDKFAESIREEKKKKIVFDFKKKFIPNSTIGETFESELYTLKNLKEKTKYDTLALFHTKERNQISVLIDKTQRYFWYKRLFKSKAIVVIGNAGCGKTFALCKIAGDLCMKTNVYLFFGTDFSANESPLDTIARKMNWNQSNAFDLLNEKMERVGKYAIFIIDAINEGAGMYFWHDKLPVLLNKIEKWNRIKFIFSVREQAGADDILNETVCQIPRIRVVGFKDIRKAINIFFDYYRIDGKVDDYSQIQTFKNPLFLKIFCEAYSETYYPWRERPNIIDIYQRYIYKRNHSISADSDADPRMNYTERILEKLARYSLYNLQCGDIPREKAKSYSYHLCPYRTWSKDLLNNTLRANLLMEYTTYDDKEWITFEYDSMGDYLKASILLNQKDNDYSKLKFITRLFDFSQGRFRQSIDGAKIKNFIKAFLSVWNPDANVWHDKEIENGKLTELFIESLALRNIDNDKLKTDASILKNILDKNPNILNPDVFISLLENNNTTVIEEFHNKLISLKLADRDLVWSIPANSLNYSINEEIKKLWENKGINRQLLLVFECWLLSASYPSVRFPVIRFIVNQLETLNDTNAVVYLIDKFKDVDDPYIQQGLCSAIYGYIVRKRVADMQISRSVKENFYPKEKCAPNDFVLRYWTLKILEWQSHLAGDDSYWKAAQPPYQVQTDNPYKNIPQGDIPEDFFGESYGANSLHRSLFTWDFYRYILGGNTSDDLDKFVDNQNTSISIWKTAKAIALLIKNKYGWNEALGDYDNGVPYESSHYHKTERIGKKYQWLGMSEVYAYLLDTCKLKVDRWSQKKKIRPKNYPWLVSNRIYFDPTLNEDDSLDDTVKELFDEYPKDATKKQNMTEWINDEKAMPPFIPIQHDKSGEEWVVLQGYDTRKENDADECVRERFVYYNTCLVDDKDKETFSEWAKAADFYGRWMPESTGSIDYLWSDYPWANAYTESLYEDEYQDGKIPCHTELPYAAQLQEDYRGITNEEVIASTVYAPSADMMKSLGFYTAERGIIKKNGSDEIVAINRMISGESFHGLLIKRKYLNDYLDNSGKCLFYCLLGEKNIVGTGYQMLNRHDLTGAALYKDNDVAEMIQPLRFEPKEEPQKESEGEDEYGLGMPIEKWLAMPTQNSSALFDRLKELAELSKQNGAKE
ncbi:MAG: trypsin-like peptidase domain-containing protein [Segatella copri]